MKTIKSRIPAYVITALLLIALTACQSEQAAEIVDIALLIKTQVIESRHLIAKHLDVGKTVDIIVKTAGLCHSV